MTLIKLGRIYFNRWIKKRIKQQFEYDNQPIILLDLGPATNVLYDYLSFFFILSFAYRLDYYLFELFLVMVELIMSGFQYYLDVIFFTEKKLEYKHKRLEIFEDWVFSFHILYSYIPLPEYNEVDLEKLLHWTLPLTGFFLYYAVSDAIGFVNYFGTSELEQASNKPVLLYYFERILYSPDILQILRHWHDKPITEWSDLQLMSIFLFEIHGLQNVRLFRDYRQAQPLEDIVALNWFYTPLDLAFTMFKFGGSLVGFYTMFVYLDAAFAVLVITGGGLVLDFAVNFVDIFRYLSTVSEYRKLFYKQIVFLPKAIKEVVGTPNFFLKSLKKEINNFRKYYEDKVATNQSFEKSTNKITDTQFNSDIGIDLNYVTFESWTQSEYCFFLSSILKRCTDLNFTENQKLNIFKSLNLLPLDFNYQQKILDQQILFFSYHYAFSSSNDPEVINREFQSKEFKNSILKDINVPEISIEQHEVIQQMFTPEGFFAKTKLEEFEKFFGSEFVNEVLKNTKTKEQTDYESFIENRKNEKKKKKEQKRQTLFKTLNLKFNIEQEQLLVDYLISLIPPTYDYFVYLYYKFIKIGYRFLNIIFLLIIQIFRRIWRLCKKFSLVLYRGFFFLIQWCYNFPYLIYIYLFFKKLTIIQQQNLKNKLILFNKKLNNYNIQVLLYLRKNYTLPDFRFTSLEEFFFYIKKTYYFLRLKILQIITQERYEDIFSWMSDPEIRAEVISEILSHQKDLGYTIQEGDDRYWDDPRILSLEGYSYVLDYNLGHVFGPVCMAAGGSLLQYLIYASMAGYPYIPWFELEHEGFLNYYGVFNGLLVTTIAAGDWSLFDTWYDSVPYISFQAERLSKEEMFADLINSTFDTEQDHPTTYLDETVFGEESTELYDFGLRVHITTTEPIRNLEKTVLATSVNAYGKPLQFFELPYGSMTKFVKKRNLSEYTLFATKDNWRRDGYSSRRARFASYAKHNLIMTEYFERPKDPNERFWHLNTKLKRLYKDFRHFGIRIFYTKDFYLRQYYRFNRFAGDTIETLEEIKPYEALMLEVKQAYYDFHILNYPIFAKHHYQQFFDEEWAEDGNEDTLDELDNGQYVFDNYHRIIFESYYTIFKIDCEYWFLRLWANFKLEIISMHYYLQPVFEFYLNIKTKINIFYLFLKKKF
jgi:hypothetical protein